MDELEFGDCSHGRFEAPDPVGPGHLPYTFNHIDELNDWPQRLLHVPSMTSYSWTTGNFYNGVKEPAYRAISYTWGRFRLAPSQQRHIGPILPIQGVEWNIPRIDPAHISRAQMEAVIRTILEADAEWPFPEVRKLHQKLDPRPTEFIWLDVACIDQRGGPVAAMEIGRQAAIFRKAAFVGFWLSRTAVNDSGWERLQAFFTLDYLECGKDTVLPNEQIPPLLQGVKEMLSDPWFSSLWTLQEAYLSPQACIISGNGRLFTQSQGRRSVQLWDLGHIKYCVQKIKSRPETHSLSTDRLKVLYELDELIEASGLELLTSGSFVNEGRALELLVGAQHRQTTYARDRIYGIMQVFGFKLGSSRRGCEHIIYSPEELKDQLGEALLREYPLQSQWHVFRAPAPAGMSWHISEDSFIPRHLRHRMLGLGRVRKPESSWPEFLKLGKRPIVLSAEEVPTGGRKLGRFEGFACPFSKLWDVWNVINDPSNGTSSDGLGSVVNHFERKMVLDGSIRNWNDKSVCEFFPDESPIYDNYDCGEFRLIRDDGDVTTELLAQHAFGSFLAAKFSSARLIVLHLVQDTAEDEWKFYGLLLLHVLDAKSHTLYWHRLGVVKWIYSPHDYDYIDHYDMCSHLLQPNWRTLMEATGDDWEELKGLFG